VARPLVTHRIVLAKGVKSPSWFSNITLVTEKRIKVLGKNRTVVQIRGESQVGFLPSGIVDVKLKNFKKPLVIFGEDEVMFIEYMLSCGIYRVKNYHFCLDCVANSGVLVEPIGVRIEPDVRHYKCVNCSDEWSFEID
jgi:hypothetical protein